MKGSILIDLERLRYPNSGIANVFRYLAKGISAMKSGFEIHLFGPEDEIKRSSLQFKVVPRRVSDKYFESFSNKYDIIHVSHQLSPYFSKDYSQAKKIVTLHDLNFLHENFSELKRFKMLKKVNRSLKYADYVVCISKFVKDDFEKNQNLFTLKKLKETAVIYNGFIFPENKTYSIEKFTELKNKKYLLNIGVLFPKKNQLSLIRMLPFIEEDLVLVASGSKRHYGEEVRHEIKRLGLEDRVHIMKHISDEEKFALIQNSEGLCQPSLAEGFGIPPIEAMFFGKPVFLSTYTSLPEVGGDLAFYFEDFDGQKMAEVIKNGLQKYKAHPEMQEQMKEWALQFDYKIMAQKYLDFYQKVLNSN